MGALTGQAVVVASGEVRDSDGNLLDSEGNIISEDKGDKS